MPKHLRREEIVTIQVLNEKGENNCQVARLLGVSEGTVRYHWGRAAHEAGGWAAKQAVQGEGRDGGNRGVVCNASRDRTAKEPEKLLK